MKMKNWSRVGWAVTTLLCSFCLSGQVIRVIDENSQRPVPDVFLVHENRQFASFTDSFGKADISEFPSQGKIIVQHPSYGNIQTDKTTLAENQLVLVLSESVQQFQEVTVSANKWKQANTEVPNEILSISREDLQFDNPPTSAEILSNSGQVYVQKSQLGGGSPSLRGFAANSVLLVVDGIRLNNAIYRSGNLQNVINIDPHIVESTEVVFGPGSVIYGSDALGGVMDFRTRTPRWTFEGGTEAHLNAQFRYGSAANERTSHFDVTVAQEKVSYFGSISFTAFDDLKAGKRKSDAYEGHFERNFYVDRVNGQDVLLINDQPELQKNSGYNLVNALQKIRWRTSDRTDLTYSYFISTTSDIPRYDRLTQPLNNDPDSLLNAEWYYGPQSWQMHAIKFSSYAPTNLYDQMQSTLSFQFYEESRHDRRFGDNLLRNRKEEVNILTYNLDFEKTWKNGTLFYGIDGFWNDVNSQAQRRNILTGETFSASTRYPNQGSQFYSIASYGNYKWSLSDKVILNTGLRYSVVRLKAENNDQDVAQVEDENIAALASNRTNSVSLLDEVDLTNQAVTGSVSLIYNPSTKTKLSAIISSGFRAPNVDDVGKVFEIDGDAIVIPNADLKPEYSYNQELGLEHQITDLVKFKLVGYHSYLTNAIVRGEVDFNGAEALSFDGELLDLRSQVNASRARIYGASAKVRIDLSEHFKFSSTININEGEQIDNNEPIRHATPVFGRSALAYEKGTFRSEFFVDYHAAKGPDGIPTSEIVDKAYLYTDDGSPAWNTLNLRLGYSPSKYVTMESGIENILDQHYRTYSSGISAAGRNIYFSIKSSL